MGSDGPSKNRRRNGVVEPICWIVLLLLSWAGMSGELVVIGLYAVVLPGLLLLAAPNMLMYGVPLRLAFAMVRTRSVLGVLGALIVLGSVGALAFIPPMLVNENLDAEAARIQAADFDRTPSGMPAPRVIQLEVEREESCQEVCQKLLARGLADQIVQRLEDGDEAQVSSRTRAVYRLSEDCPASAISEGVSHCILRSIHPDPRVDAVLKVEQVPDEAREADHLNPRALGPQSVEVLELWACPAVGHCDLVVHRTSVVQAHLFAPMLLLAAEENLHLSRAWTRIPRGTKADPAGFLASKWPAKRVVSDDWVTVVQDADTRMP